MFFYENKTFTFDIKVSILYIWCDMFPTASGWELYFPNCRIAIGPYRKELLQQLDDPASNIEISSMIRTRAFCQLLLATALRLTLLSNLRSEPSPKPMPAKLWIV